jgi:UDP-N-acetylglucosamine 4,6-dehydratase/5-epimerase
MFDDKVVLITGGTGSFGNRYAKYLLDNYKLKKLIIFSRDEMKQWFMSKKFANYSNIRFFIGDVRDLNRLHRAFSSVDYVVHAAATKIVPTAEYNPFECVKTNVMGAMNIIDASIDCGVKKVVALSTDKASSPINLYGATKLTADKLFIAGNAYSDEHTTSFSVARYGNVMGSRGSVIPFFHKMRDQPTLPITHEAMTRFLIDFDQAISLVQLAFKDMVGGEIYVPKIPSMKVVDIANTINPEAETDLIGVRPGEKIHEQMIGAEDAPFTLEYDEYFKILPMINNWADSPQRIGDGKPVPDDFTYSSDNNKDWMTPKCLLDWIALNSENLVAD